MDLQRWIDEWVTLDTEEQKADFDKRFKEWVHSVPEDKRVSFEEMVYQSAISEVENAEDIIEVANIRKVLEPIINYISLSEIAVRDFGKTGQWLYQRLNGSIVNGKPAKFTSEELNNLSFTLEEIAGEHEASGSVNQTLVIDYTFVIRKPFIPEGFTLLIIFQ